MPIKKGFKTFYAVSFAWQLGFLIAVPLGFFLLLGKFVDNFFHSSPWFLILGMLLGLVSSIYEIYHSLQPIIKKDDKGF